MSSTANIISGCHEEKRVTRNQLRLARNLELVPRNHHNYLVKLRYPNTLCKRFIYVRIYDIDIVLKENPISDGKA